MPNKYRFVKDVYDGVESYAIYTASGHNQGDMMQWDTGVRKAHNDTLASGGIFLGVAEECSPLASLGTSSVPLTGGVCRIKGSGVHRFKTTNSETYVHLTPVYQGADVQTVTTVKGSNRMIGRVHLPGGESVTGAAGTDIPVRIFGNLACTSVSPSDADGSR